MKYKVYDIEVTDSNLSCDFFHDTEMVIDVPDHEDVIKYILEYLLENLEVETDTPDWVEVELYAIDFEYKKEE
jgi:hypothetical protein